MTDQAAYRRYTAEAANRVEAINGLKLTTAEATAHIAAAQVYATLALAAAQERVQPADRPTDDQDYRNPTFIVVNNELVKPTEAAVERNVVMTDDRGRRWAAAAGADHLYWEAVQV